MRENDLLARSRAGSPRGLRSHDGSIIPGTVDTMGGTDRTTTITGEGQAVVLVAVDHCSADRVGIHADRRATRFRALEPIRQRVRPRFGGFTLLPAFAEHDAGSDWNDLARSDGPETARQQLLVAVAIAEREQIVQSLAADRDREHDHAPVRAPALDRERTAEAELER